jgi:uncharacterized SAM-binding protein YcdF (DUF218 family)
LKRLAGALLLLAALWMGTGAALVLGGEPRPSYEHADVAVVLGAAVRADGSPSPVLQGRLEHALALHRRGFVRKLLFTGGRGEGLPRSEAAAAKAWALARGVDPAVILIEERSRTTRQNLLEARPMLRHHGLRSVLLVSDPLHLPRATHMAHSLDIDARPSATPSTRYRSFRTRLPFLARESFFMTLTLIFRV